MMEQCPEGGPHGFDQQDGKNICPKCGHVFGFVPPDGYEPSKAEYVFLFLPLIAVALFFGSILLVLYLFF